LPRWNFCVRNTVSDDVLPCCAEDGALKTPR
jgi:hypothetical protein